MSCRIVLTAVLVSALFAVAERPLRGSSETAAPTTGSPVPAAPAPAPGMHRFMVVRTFAPGALDGLDAQGKKQVNKTNATRDVTWVFSFANADKTKTFCVYNGPNEAAVRDVAKANNIPVDYIVEVPVILLPN